MNSNYTSPWDREDVFPEKPTGEDYGYLLRGKFVGCSQEGLIKKCGSRDLPHVHLVWCPEFPRVVPAAMVGFLSEPLRERQRSELKSAIGVGLSSFFIWCVLGFLTSGSSHRPFAWTWMLLLATTTGLIPAVSGIYGIRKLKHDFALTTENIKIARYNVWVLSQKILFTWLILGGIGGVFILECVYGFPESVNAAGLDKHAVWRGEWWRLFTGPLLHGNVMHFIFNASALIGLGRLMEVLASRYYLAFVFGVSALIGSVFSLFLLPDVTSVGASGGLLGLIGFLAVLGYKRKQVLPPGFAKSVAINVAIIAAMGILAFSIIDNAAHLGGFLAGVILGNFFARSGEQSLPLVTGVKIKIAGIISLFAILVFVGYSMMQIFENNHAVSN
ncbi:MAG TPA: rhomboid family intramembrane serine protease [Verrucomicrobiae bacterium]|nr:rhomboid family intramembrane serine protease [Verrucomicrobiae bacterium]